MDGTASARGTTTAGAGAAADTADAGVTAAGRWRWLHWAALAVVLLGSLAIRLHVVDQQSVWGDEVHTLTQSSGWRFVLHEMLPAGRVVSGLPQATGLEPSLPWWSLWHRQGYYDSHPPLFTMILRAWRAVAGESVVAARMLSVVSSVAAMLLLYVLGRDLHGRGAALWACLLMAVGVSQIAYSVEIRPYVLLVALGLASMLLVVRIERQGATWPRLVLLGILFLSMPLIHYFAAGGLVGLAMYGLLRLRGRELRWVLATACVAIVAYLIIWGPYLAAQRTHTRFAFLEEPQAGHVRWTCQRVALLPLRFMSEPRQEASSPAPEWYRAAGLLYLVPLLRLRRRPDLLLPWLWMVGSVGMILALDLARSTCQLAYIRYAFLAAPGIFLLVPATLADLGGVVKHAAPAALTIYGILMLPNLSEPRTEDWRGMARLISQSPHAAAPAVLAVPAGEQWLANLIHSGLSHYAYVPDRRWAYLPIPNPSAIAELGPGPIWVVSTGQVDVRNLFPDGQTLQSWPIRLVGTLSLVSLPDAPVTMPSDHAGRP